MPHHLVLYVSCVILLDPDCLSSSFAGPLCNNSWKNLCDKVASTNIPCHIDWFCDWSTLVSIFAASLRWFLKHGTAELNWLPWSNANKKASALVIRNTPVSQRAICLVCHQSSIALQHYIVVDIQHIGAYI